MNDRTVKHISINIMEELVAEEVTRQFKRYPESVTQYINRVEVATFALNRLPPLYASCHKGLNQQKLKGKTDFSAQITKAVRQGFAAVQKDVLRYSTPLQPEDNSFSETDQNEELEEARQALAELAEFFPHGKVSWGELVKLVKPLLMKRYQSKSSNTKKNMMWY
jgi:hypothetical protein